MVAVVRHLCTACVVVAAGTLLLPRIYDAPETARRLATMPVVVATKDIPEGVMIDRSAVAVAKWPSQTVPHGAYPFVDAVISRVARINVFKGEPILPGRLAP